MAQPALRTAVLDCLLRQVLPVVAVRMEAAAAAGPNWESVQLASAAQVGAISFLPPHMQGARQPGVAEVWLEGLLRSQDTRPFCQLDLAVTCVNTLREPGELPWQAVAELLPTVARLAAALLAQRPAVMPPRAFAIIHGSLASLAAMCSFSLTAEAARQLALPQTAASRAALATFVANQLSPAAWSTIRLVPYMARTLRAVAADLPATAEDFCALASMYKDRLQLLSSVGPQPAWQVGSWEQLSEWAAAADAGLRMLATLVEVRGACESCDAQLVTGLPPALLTCLGVTGARSASDWCDQSSPVPTASRPALAAQLWQLHSSVVRLVHLPGGGPPPLRLSEDARQRWPEVCSALLHHIFLPAFRLLSANEEQLR